MFSSQVRFFASVRSLYISSSYLAAFACNCEKQVEVRRSMHFLNVAGNPVGIVLVLFSAGALSSF